MQGEADICFATIAAGTAVAGAAVGAYGKYQEGQATKTAALYQAQVAKNNAEIADTLASNAVATGRVKTENQSRKGAAIAGRIKAAQAANGVDVNSGSNVDVQQSQREQAQLDTETTMHNAELEGYGYRTRATNYQAEAGLDVMKGEQAEKAGEIGAVSTLLGGASSLGSKWSSLGKSSISPDVA